MSVVRRAVCMCLFVCQENQSQEQLLLRTRSELPITVYKPNQPFVLVYLH